MEEFDQVYRRHFPGVFRFAEAQAGRRDVAENLVTRAFQDLHRYFEWVPAARLPGWLFDIVSSGAREFWQKELAAPHHAQWLEGPALSPQAAPPGPAWLTHPELTSAERACLELHYVWDVPVPEIALRLGLGSQEVDARIDSGVARGDAPAVDLPLD